MNSTKINQILNEVILDKFLINFIPGLILYFCLHSFVPFTSGNWLTSFFILITVTWFLGLILEFLFFQKTFNRRREVENFVLKNCISLLFAKVAVAILISIAYSISHYVYVDTPHYDRDQVNNFMNLIFESVFFGLLAVYFLYYYWKSSKKTKSVQ